MSIGKKSPSLNSIINQSPLAIQESRLLLYHLSGSTLESLLSHPETTLKLAVYQKYKKLEKKRLSGWPLAYLTGHKDFYSRRFLVTPAVLIPRPETEMIVDLVIETLKNKPYDQIIDIGTGSGAIIISLVSEIKRHLPAIFKKIKFSASDISTAALKIAKANANLNKVSPQVTFKHGHLLKPFLSGLQKNNYQSLLITANLPYLTPQQIAASPTIQKEPRLALDGGTDGLDLYRQLFKQIAELKQATPLTMILEIDPSQSRKIISLARALISGSSSQIILDLAGKKRFVLISR